MAILLSVLFTLQSKVDGTLVSKPREYVHLLTERLLALTDVLDLVGDLLALDDEGDLGTVEGKSHRVRLLKVFVNYFSYNHRRLDGLIENGLLELKSSASLLLFSDPLLSLQKMHTPLGVTGHEDRAVRREGASRHRCVGVENGHELSLPAIPEPHRTVVRPRNRPPAIRRQRHRTDPLPCRPSSRLS